MKRGFTLIELLAVIVILAIIALIAVPIVIHIINDSKNSSDEQTVELYLDTAVKTITKNQISNTNFNPDKCKIQSNGDLDCYKGNNKIETLKIDVNGQMPEKGIIELQNNKYIYKNIWFNNKKYYSISTLIDDADNDGEISIGDKYLYKINDTDTFTFYVLSIEGTGTNQKVNLIMDRNICNDGTVEYTSTNNYCIYKWYSERNYNIYGPVTAMQELYEGTKDWDNVDDMVMNYTDENNGTATDKGYTSIITNNGVTTITGKPTTNTATVGTSSKPLKARLPKESEVTGAGCTTSSGSCPVWLIENMTYWNVSNDKYSMNNNSEAYQYQIYAYWLLSSVSGNAGEARYVGFNGRVYGGATANGGLGVRAVITVSMSDLS